MPLLSLGAFDKAPPGSGRVHGALQTERMVEAADPGPPPAVERFELGKPWAPRRANAVRVVARPISIDWSLGLFRIQPASDQATRGCQGY